MLKFFSLSILAVDIAGGKKVPGNRAKAPTIFLPSPPSVFMLVSGEWGEKVDDVAGRKREAAEFVQTVEISTMQQQYYY